jgi:hypothetical protein
MNRDLQTAFPISGVAFFNALLTSVVNLFGASMMKSKKNRLPVDDNSISWFSNS